jgi:hypothetical protein
LAASSASSTSRAAAGLIGAERRKLSIGRLIDERRKLSSALAAGNKLDFRDRAQCPAGDVEVEARPSHGAACIDNHIIISLIGCFHIL